MSSLQDRCASINDAALAARLQRKFDAEHRQAQKRIAEDADLASALQSSLEGEDDRPSQKRPHHEDARRHERASIHSSSSGFDPVRPLPAPRDEIRSLGGEIRIMTSTFGVVPPSPVYHLPKFLPSVQQANLFNLLHRDGLLTEAATGASIYQNPFQLLSWGDKESNNISIKPSQLLAFDIGQQALAYVTECKADQLWGESVHLNWCLTATYSQKGNLHMHTDSHAPGWVVILSLGSQADFRFDSADLNLARSCILESGDVMILKGSEVLHGIHRVFGDVPAFWTLKHARRLAIQMRDHRQMTTSSSPYARSYYKVVRKNPVQPAT